MIAPLSGPSADLWSDTSNIYKEAVENFNNTSTWVKVELILEDGKCNAQDGQMWAQKLITIDKVDLLIGAWCSATSLIVAENAQKNRVLYFEPNASHPGIVKKWDYVYQFWNWESEDFGWKLAQFANKNYKNIAILKEKNDFIQSFDQIFENIYTWKIVLNESFIPWEKDFALLMQKVAKEKENINWIIFMPWTSDSAMNMYDAFLKSSIYDEFSWKVSWPIWFGSKAFINKFWGKADWLIEVQLWLNKNSLWDEYKTWLTNAQNTYWINYESFSLLYKEWITFVLEWVKSWNYDSESMKRYFFQITKENPRKWIFWDYYFQEDRLIKGLKFIIQQIQSGQVVPRWIKKKGLE